MAEPRISGIEVHTYTYALDDLGKDYNGFNLVYVPGGTVQQTGHIIRILTDVGVVGEYAGGSAADYAILPSLGGHVSSPTTLATQLSGDFAWSGRMVKRGSVSARQRVLF